MSERTERVGPPSRGGRKRDHSRDAVILEATLDVLAESGFDGMTIDMVAVRAGAARATVYRRWPTKIDLVLDAVKRLAPGPAELERLPDTGSLRGDLVASMQPDTSEESERRVRVVAGLQSIAERNEDIAAVLTGGGTEPWIEANRILIRRAVDRGEYGPVDVDALAQVLPLMCTCRVAVQRLPITPEYAIGLIDAVLLPAMRSTSKEKFG
ncbi:TetR/AcrR family transcriptional regulator C-terminal ligand-binding domain-containing protein [Actinoplanes sp. LDG1-06]|uniref:TetR/AcrR family transcriptional regulator C-terminal ligand-binding domain-containing protein n=1 Tax=Paractinoplanes ovalisporus TaxID=2810368 RepID=A0ABS2A3X0_9ACTN|nr:TetR-like C-terminal domain-containing protein [Actinoplanes ovalisporus]MBM2614538.1 TetR/AcrR family transcriptional regulator C-terminal ligand-binding domain-containing protein [Actinoplanes ovalisporus]